MKLPRDRIAILLRKLLILLNMILWLSSWEDLRRLNEAAETLGGLTYDSCLRTASMLVRIWSATSFFPVLAISSASTQL